MANPPSYDFYHSDFTAGTYMMTLAEVGCYIRLLNHQFVEGQIPNNPAVMSRLCVCDQVDFDRAWAVVKQKFQETEDGTGYVNAKMSEIREKTLKRWTANRENGKLGGRPKKNPMVRNGLTQTKPNGKVEVGRRSKKKECFKKPTVDEVAEYCRERKNKVNAATFVDHYESNGWKVGRNSMKDWKAAVRNWEKNDFGSGKPASMSADDYKADLKRRVAKSLNRAESVPGFKLKNAE